MTKLILQAAVLVLISLYGWAFGVKSNIAHMLLIVGLGSLLNVMIGMTNGIPPG